MVKRIVLFLIRRKLRVKKWEKFRFANQSSKNDYYYFSNNKIIKVQYRNKHIKHPLRIPSNVSLNWLLDKKCKIVKI